ncbi:MAG: hypothetical protein ACK5U4_24575, partial [Rhodospirillales bacterium]
VEAPKVYRGIDQMPLHGSSLAYTFDAADAPSRHITQYFEMGGQRGIWHDGWKAVTNHRSGEPYENDKWELYDVRNDYSETVDLVEQEPARLKEMIELWWREAEAYNVTPLDDRAQARAFARDPETSWRSRYVLYPGGRLMTPVTGPNFSMRPFKIAAHVEARAKGEEGVLFAYGRRAAGFSLFIQGDSLVFEYNLAGRRTTVETKPELPSGAHVFGCVLTMDGTEASLDLTVDGEVTHRAKFPPAFPAGFGVLPSHCGLNTPSPVSPRYEAPFRFTGQLDRVEVDLGPANMLAIASLWTAAIRNQ